MAKLVEILARELGEWPEGADFAYSSGKLARFATDANGTTSQYCPIRSEAEDDGKAMVTRAEWQAAVDALNKSNIVALKKPSWNGEGLPPVGIDVEFKHTGLEEGEWVRCYVVGYYDGHLYGHTSDARWSDTDGVCHLQLDEGLPTAIRFRSISEAEALAAKNRDEQTKVLYYTINHNDNPDDWAEVPAYRKSDYARAIEAGWVKKEAE